MAVAYGSQEVCCKGQVILSDDGDPPGCAKPSTPNDAFNKLAMVLQYLCNETKRLRKHVSLSAGHSISP